MAGLITANIAIPLMKLTAGSDIIGTTLLFICYGILFASILSLFLPKDDAP